MDVGEAPEGLNKRKRQSSTSASSGKKSRMDDPQYLYNNNNNNNNSIMLNNNNNLPLRKSLDKRSMDSVLRKLTLGVSGKMQEDQRSPSPSHLTMPQGDGEMVERQLREMIEQLELARRRLLGDQRAQREDHILQALEAVANQEAHKQAAEARLHQERLLHSSAFLEHLRELHHAAPHTAPAGVPPPIQVPPLSRIKSISNLSGGMPLGWPSDEGQGVPVRAELSVLAAQMSLALGNSLPPMSSPLSSPMGSGPMGMGMPPQIGRAHV